MLSPSPPLPEQPVSVSKLAEATITRSFFIMSSVLETREWACTVFAEGELGEETVVPLGALEDRIAVVVHDQAVATTVFGEFEMALADLEGTTDDPPIVQEVILAPGAHYAVEVVPR